MIIIVAPITIPINADVTNFNAAAKQVKGVIDTMNGEKERLKTEITMTFNSGLRFASMLAMNFKQNALSQAFIATQQYLSLGISMKTTATEISKAYALGMGGQPTQFIIATMLTGVLATQTSLRISASMAQKQAQINSRRAERMRLFTESYR